MAVPVGLRLGCSVSIRGCRNANIALANEPPPFILPSVPPRMGTGEPHSPSRASLLPEPHPPTRVLLSIRALRPRDLQRYRACENATEGVLYFMVVFSPWAFGTTQPWAIGTMDAAGCLLGLLLALKLWIRWWKGYRPARWGRQGSHDERPRHSMAREPPASREDAGHQAPAPGDGSADTAASPALAEAPAPAQLGGHGGREVIRRHKRRKRRHGWERRLTAVLIGLAVAILGYCLISALNASATYRPEDLSFVYHRHAIKWLPSSLDSASTWAVFWNYLALACAFLALRDWLPGKSDREQRADYEDFTRSRFVLRAPDRLRRLLWVMALNGGLLGLEGIAQRLAGTGYLLFILKPAINRTAEAQFGPYAYRGNAAAYFNLLWPVCLGFWWALQPSRAGATRHNLLLFCAGFMAVCPMVSTSRAGAVVDMGLLAAGTACLLLSSLRSGSHAAEQGGSASRNPRQSRSALLLWFCAGVLVLGFAFGWKTLQPRWSRLARDYAARNAICEQARPMAEDYPVFGTGPGTFQTVFSLYRFSTDTYWPAQIHNDWLETRITFGWAGSALIALAFATVLVRWFLPGGIHGGRRFVLLIWLALAGCLVHARYDFPFQIYSILFLFLVLCAILSDLTRGVEHQTP